MTSKSAKLKWAVGVSGLSPNSVRAALLMSVTAPKASADTIPSCSWLTMASAMRRDRSTVAPSSPDPAARRERTRPPTTGSALASNPVISTGMNVPSLPEIRTNTRYISRPSVIRATALSATSTSSGCSNSAADIPTTCARVRPKSEPTASLTHVTWSWSFRTTTGSRRPCST